MQWRRNGSHQSDVENNVRNGTGNLSGTARRQTSPLSSQESAQVAQAPISKGGEEGSPVSVSSRLRGSTVRPHTQFTGLAANARTRKYRITYSAMISVPNQHLRLHISRCSVRRPAKPSPDPPLWRKPVAIPSSPAPRPPTRQPRRTHRASYPLSAHIPRRHIPRHDPSQHLLGHAP